MRCPTCQNELTPTVNGDAWCTQCAQAVSPRAPTVAKVAAAPFAGRAAAGRQRHLPPFVLPLGAVLLLALLALVLGSRGGGDSEPEPLASAAAAADAPSESASAPSAPAGRLARQIEDAQPARNDIERARNATVFIKTPWSVGSGFFVGSDCRVLSNRHVVALSDGRVDTLRGELHAAERQLAQANRWLEQKKEHFRRQCRDCSEDAWQRFVGGDIDTVRNAEMILEDRRQQVLGLQHGGELKAVLADGTEHALEIVRLSDRYDLALLRVAGSGCPRLQTTSSDSLQLGQTLFTIGSPRGLRHKVTSGVFSGYIESPSTDDSATKVRVLQTDAPINPGNSGGPLIDETGRVVGINSAVLRDSEGIGLAIPIELAFDEFAL